MADQQLMAYVRDARSRGMKDEEITSKLKEQGWDDLQVKQALGYAAVSTPQAPSAPGHSFAAVPSEAAASAVVRPVTHHKRYIAYVNAFLILVIVGGGTAYAYNAGLIPFISGAPYSRVDVVGKGLSKLADIDTAKYALGFSFKDEPRSANARAFSYDKEKVRKEIEAQRPAYERDYARMQALQGIISHLRSYQYSKNGAYPARLTDLKAWEESSTSYSSYEDELDQVMYSRNADGKGYALSITFETAEAVSAIQDISRYTSAKNAVIVSGKKVTLDEKSTYLYVYSFSQNPPKPPVVEFVENRDMALVYLPSDMNVEANVSGTIRFSGADASDKNALWGGSGEVSVDAKAEFGDSAYMLGFDIRLLSDSAYFKLNKFPSIPFIPYDFGAVKGKWVELTKENAVEYLGVGELEYDNVADEQKALEEAIDIYKKIGTIIAEDGVISAESGPKKEKVGTVSAYKYTFSIDREKIVPTYKRIVNEVLPQYEKRLGKATVDQEFVQFIESDLFKDFFEHLRQNNELSIWFDKEGFPIKIGFTSRIIPLDDTAKLKNRQYMLNLTYTLSDINKPISVQKPAEFIEFDKASELITGVSLKSARTKGKNAAIKSNLANIRAQAELVYDNNYSAVNRASSYGSVYAEAACSDKAPKGTLFANTVIAQMLQSARDASPDGESRCAGNPTSWAAAVELFPEDEYSSKSFWCVDSTGRSKEIFTDDPATVIKGTATTDYSCK